MSLALVHSRAQVGVQAPAVSVETHLANGLPHLTLVGLPEIKLNQRFTRFFEVEQRKKFDFAACRLGLRYYPDQQM